MRVVIEFSSSEGAAEGGNRVDFTVIGTNGKDSSDSVVGSISFDYRRERGIEVMKDWSRCKCVLKGPESLVTGERPIPR